MVYDEGFEITIGDKTTQNYKNYFIFLRYSFNKKRAIIKSNFTSHCYQTLIGWYHIGDNHWGCFKGHKDIQNWGMVTNGEANDKQIVVQGSITKDPNIIEEGYSPRFLQNESKMRHQLKLNNKNKVLNEIKISLESKNHNQFVKQINSMNLSWKAAEYDEFKGYSFAEINEFMRKNNGKFNFNLTKNKSKIIKY